MQQDLNWAARGTDLPRGFEVQWLGTAGFRLRYEQTTVLIDPFLTRRSLAASLRTTPLLSNPAVVAQRLDGASAVLVGHTHFDHAVDVPEIARRFDCPAYGSSSLRRVIGHDGVDVFLCGIAGRVDTPHFTRRILQLVRPAVFVAHHDDVSRPVDAAMGFSVTEHLEGLADEVATAARDVALRTLEPLQRVSG